MTKVRITGQDAFGPGRVLEVEVNAKPESAADHPEVRRLERVLLKHYKKVTVKIIE